MYFRGRVELAQEVAMAAGSGRQAAVPSSSNLWV
jgi:hypothetical protein